MRHFFTEDTLLSRYEKPSGRTWVGIDSFFPASLVFSNLFIIPIVRGVIAVMTFADYRARLIAEMIPAIIPVSIILLVLFIIKRVKQTSTQTTLDVEAPPLEKSPIAFSPTYINEKADSEWLPPNQFNGNPWMAKVLAEADASTADLHPILKDFKLSIESDPILYMLFRRMFKEVPEAQDPTGRPEVRDYDHMLKAFNVVLSMGPPWSYTTNGQKGAIGAPITAIINWPMGTKAGREAFLNPIVNQHIKNTLNAWSLYLSSPASAAVLNSSDDGWLCTSAKKTMAEVATLHTHLKHEPKRFEDMFICTPSAPNLGYKSWDDFFTRRFRSGMRPVPPPIEGKPLIVSACESAPYRISHDVAARAKFWLKTQPYSLIDILNGSAYYQRFVGGTIYQAYLSALSYHRWHAPISGTILKIDHVPGTYFAENYREPYDPADPVGPLGAVLRQSQGYITEIAARMVIYIEADDVRVGIVACVMIGMVEVSSMEATRGEGAHVDVGEEMGMFHYGGSSHCLIFERGKEVEFVEAARDHSGGKNVAVCSRLATIV